jgi:hypothetical protein
MVYIINHEHVGIQKSQLPSVKPKLPSLSRRILLEGAVICETSLRYQFRNKRKTVWVSKDVSDWDKNEQVLDIFLESALALGLIEG